MAKKAKDIKPIFPLKHKLYNALDDFIKEATMLANTARFIAENGDLKPGLKVQLEKQLEAFNAARQSRIPE